jgi:hypothetical protein
MSISIAGVNERPNPSSHRNETWKPRIAPKGSLTARVNNGYAGMGGRKKRKVDCNGQHKVQIA